MNPRFWLFTMLISWIAAGSVLADVSGSQEVTTSVSDKEITSRVRKVFAKHPDLGVQYSVSTRHGVVYLKGIFSSGLMKSTAEALAMDVTGVKQVVDLAGISK